MTQLLLQAGFRRCDVVLWNVVPYCVSSADRNRNPSVKAIRDAYPYTARFLSLLPHLRVIVLCGRRAQRVGSMIKMQGPKVLQTFHPGAQSVDSDEAGHAFQTEAGHLFQFHSGRCSDLKPATFWV